MVHPLSTFQTLVWDPQCFCMLCDIDRVIIVLSSLFRFSFPFSDLLFSRFCFRFLVLSFQKLPPLSVQALVPRSKRLSSAFFLFAVLDKESNNTGFPSPADVPFMPILTASTTYSSFVPFRFHPEYDLGVLCGLQGSSLTRIEECHHSSSPHDDSNILAGCWL